MKKIYPVNALSYRTVKLPIEDFMKPLAEVDLGLLQYLIWGSL